MTDFEKGTYGYDLALLEKYTQPVELKAGEMRVLISPEYQGRVMTSSASAESGKSYGWINHELIASGKTLAQINPVGGEERFWLGPEGGQFSLFFKPGDSFDFQNWQTPSAIDTEPFDLVSSTERVAEFQRTFQLTNYQNFTFRIDVNRKIELIEPAGAEEALGIQITEGIKSVGYQTINHLKNAGEEEWTKKNGLISVWLLGMYNPSPSVTMVIPYKTDVESDYIVKDDYFGKIPEERLKVKEGFIFFKGDGKERGKIGVPPERAKPVLGSYDSQNRVLTVVSCEIPEGETDYVNSSWEHQEFPFRGDAINAYNDGPVEDGSQLGPFYELETSSQALALKPGEDFIYRQSTFHFEGEEEELNAICLQVFNISLEEVKNALP